MIQIKLVQSPRIGDAARITTATVNVDIGPLSSKGEVWVDRGANEEAVERYIDVGTTQKVG